MMFTMFTSEPELSSPQYSPIAFHDDGEHTSTGSSTRKSSSSENDNSTPLLEAPDNFVSSKSSYLPKLVIYFSLALALLSAINVSLLPATLTKYRSYPLSESELEALPYGDARLGLDRAAKIAPPARVYHRSWPDRIVRVSRKLKDAVYGDGVQVYITAEDSTIMRFPIPTTGAANGCAITWRPPPEFSARTKDITTKGDVSEIEVWQVIAPSLKDKSAASGSLERLDYDTISYSTLPVRGELLGVLDLTAKPNSTTVQFACPDGESEAENGSLVLEMRCQRVACHVSFEQIDMAPRFGFELARRVE